MFSTVHAPGGSGYWTSGHYLQNSATLCLNNYFTEGLTTQKALNPKTRAFVGKAECLVPSTKEMSSVAIVTPLLEPDNIRKFYACPPCGCNAHDKTFASPGKCPDCEM